MWFNEIEPYPAQWLRNLYPEAIVNETDIRELRANDIPAGTAHFFAGIGGWQYALDLAGWTNGNTWTGSCPCQPFSSAGKRKGQADKRHLWPDWFRLIQERRPQYIFGEQVASAIGHGWLDGVFADLEAEGYTCGALVLGAHSVGSPHIRQRLYWLAYLQGERCDGGQYTAKQTGRAGVENSSGLGDATGEQVGTTGQPRGQSDACCRLGDANEQGQPRQSFGLLGTGDKNPWSDYELIQCADGKARRVKPGLKCLADGVSNRAHKLRAYGNAIVPQTAAGGYATKGSRAEKNCHRERIWFSPHCLKVELW